MGRALMIGGVFLLSRDPEGLVTGTAPSRLGARLLPDEGYYPELCFREDEEPGQRQHLSSRSCPGDPGTGEGHIINYRVDNIEAVVESLREGGIEIS